MSLFRDHEQQTFMGIRVIPSEHVQPVPVLQISPTFEWCTSAFRAEYNAWLLERFGTKEVVYMFQMPSGGDVLAMNPKQIAMLQLRNW